MQLLSNAKVSFSQGGATDLQKNLFGSRTMTPDLLLKKMLRHLMQNKLSIVGTGLQTDRCKGVEMREANDTKNSLHRSFMNKVTSIQLLSLQLQGAIYRPDSFVMTLRYCANLKAIRYESTNMNRIVANKSHRVIVA